MVAVGIEELCLMLFYDMLDFPVHVVDGLVEVAIGLEVRVVVRRGLGDDVMRFVIVHVIIL